jgi:hypothetical protein
MNPVDTFDSSCTGTFINSGRLLGGRLFLPESSEVDQRKFLIL